jgi:hypothetical protein
MLVLGTSVNKPRICSAFIADSFRPCSIQSTQELCCSRRKGSIVTEESNAGKNGQAPGQETQQSPYAFYVAAIAIVAPCLVYFLSMWAFGDKFQDAATPLGALFTLIGTVAGAYFGIKVSNDTSRRSQGAIERAHGSAEEANARAQQAHDTAQQALAELDPNVARRIVPGASGDARR